MKLQAILKYAKKPLIVNNIEWVTIGKSTIEIKEINNMASYYIIIKDLLSFSLYDDKLSYELSKGGGK